MKKKALMLFLICSMSMGIAGCGKTTPNVVVQDRVDFEQALEDGFTFQEPNEGSIDGPNLEESKKENPIDPMDPEYLNLATGKTCLDFDEVMNVLMERDNPVYSNKVEDGVNFDAQGIEDCFYHEYQYLWVNPNNDVEGHYIEAQYMTILDDEFRQELIDMSFSDESLLGWKLTFGFEDKPEEDFKVVKTPEVCYISYSDDKDYGYFIGVDGNSLLILTTYTYSREGGVTKEERDCYNEDVNYILEGMGFKIN